MSAARRYDALKVTKNDGSVMRTAHLVADDGWEVDLTLWTDAADCGPCHPGNDSH